MERTQIFDLMGELRLYGMKAAFDDIMATVQTRSSFAHRVPTPTRVNQRATRSRVVN